MAYTAAEIKSAIDISRSQGFSDDQILVGLARYGVTEAQANSALTAKTTSGTSTTTGTGGTTTGTGGTSTTTGTGGTTTGTGGTTTGSTTQTLTPAIAKSLMYRAMTVGVPIAELDRYGGQAVVLAAAQAAGLQGNAPSIAAYETSMGLPPSAYTLRNATAAAATTTTGTGGTSTTTGTGGTSTTTGTGGTSTTTGTGGTATTTGTGGTATTTGTGGTATTVPKVYTAAEIASAIAVSRSQGFTDAQIATGLAGYLPNAAAVTAALAANPRPATTTTTTTSTTGTGGTATTTGAGGTASTTATTAPRVYTPGEIASAIAVSRQQGFSDADIATGLGRYLPNAAAVTAALAANPRAATTTPVARTYSAAEITSAINTSRQQGFSEADIATGLGRYLPNATAVTAALAANPRAATTATGATAGAPQGLLATGAQGFNPNIAQPQRTYTSMTPGRITDTPIYNNTGTYTPEQIQSAIAVSKGQGFSDADIATGLARYGATQTPYRNLYTPESVRQVYQSPQVMDAIRTSRAQGFNEADVRTGLLRYLSPQDADAAIAASLAPAPAAATGGLLSTATPAAAPNPYAAIRAATPAFAAPSSLNLGGTGGFDSSLYGEDKYKAPVAEVLANSLNSSGGGAGGDRGNVGGPNGTYSGLTGPGSLTGQDPSKVGVTDLSSYSDAAVAEANFGKERGDIPAGGEASNAGLGEGFGGVGASPYAEGGSVRSLMSPNPPGPDDGYGSLQRGEYVIKKSAVDKYGEGLLGMINNGKVSARKLKSLLE